MAGLVAGAGVILEALVDDVEVGLVLTDNVEEIGVFRALLEPGDEGDEEGNLELDLVGVDAVENAIQFSIVEGSIEFFDGGGFGGEELFGGIEVGFFVGGGGEIIRQ